MKALIVDDERHVREAITLLVDWAEYGIDTVLEADNGERAISMIQAESPALVFTDMMMPLLGGDKLMAWMAEHATACKIIVVSGHDNFELVRTAVKYGGMDYILKPIDPVQLNAAVSRAVDSWRAEETMRSRSRGIDIELNQLKPIYAEQLFGALLKGTGSGSAQEFADLWKEGGVSLHGADVRVAVLELGSAPPALTAKFGAGGGDLLAFAVANIGSELLAAKGCGQAFRHLAGTRHEIVLLFWDALGDVPSLLVEYNDALHVAFKARFAFGAGQRAPFPQGLAGSYKEARAALLQRNLLQTGRQIHCSDSAGASSVGGVAGGFGAAVGTGVAGGAGKAGAAGSTGVAGGAGAPDPPLFFSAYEERVRYAVQNGSPGAIRQALQPWYEALDARKVITPDNLLLWQREFRLAASIWEGNAKLADAALPYAQPYAQLEDEAVPVDARGAFDFADWKESFARDALDIAKRLQAGNEKSSTIRDIAAHIERHAHEDLTLQSISDRFHLSREYISRKFKQELNENVSDYITACRINRAKALLASPHLKVTQIAEMAGFQDEKYFSKVFKKLTDQTPSEYRKGLYEAE